MRSLYQLIQQLPSDTHIEDCAHTPVHNSHSSVSLTSSGKQEQRENNNIRYRDTAQSIENTPTYPDDNIQQS